MNQSRGEGWKKKKKRTLSANSTLTQRSPPFSRLGIQFSCDHANRGGVAFLRVAQTIGCGLVFGDISVFLD